MKVHDLLAGLALAVFAAGCHSGVCLEDGVARTVSPDGRNEIRLRLKPLAYEVRRDGRTLVAPTPIGFKVNGRHLARTSALKDLSGRDLSGCLETPVYKKSRICLGARETYADFGDWGVRLVARNDGVAYRLETKMPGVIRVDGENAGVTIPDGEAACRVYLTKRFGCEESTNVTRPAKAVTTAKDEMVYLPLVYTVAGKTVAVTESDVHDYPIWNLARAADAGAGVAFGPKFAGWPKETYRLGGWGREPELKEGGRWVKVRAHEDWLVETEGTRTFPWRTFVLADEPAKLCESDVVYALARPACPKADFSWVKPGKVAWDWWNDWNLDGVTLPFKAGCNTKTYEHYIDFAQKTGVEYVIFDEGWSEKLNIWKFHPDVDVKHLIDYANARGVGIILWMAWAQVYGEEERVADYFAKLGAKGFKVDFMDRGDAACERFLWKFAKACAQKRMLVDYHGAHRPTGMSRAYPNVLNYEGIHGLECMKWYKNDGEDFMENDLKAFYCRLTAGPMDYTPGAMDNYPIGRYKGTMHNPGSVGTRCRQMAQMAMYEAPLQMLCDSPAKYARNMECFRFMAATPVTWDAVVGLGGDPETMAAVARRSKDGAWYAAAMTNAEARDWTLETAFLGAGEWRAEIFRDAPASDAEPTQYVHETKRVKAGERLAFHMARGGGFVVKFTK